MTDINSKKRKSKPLIVTNLDHDDGPANVLQINFDYLIGLENAGAIPLCLPPSSHKNDIKAALTGCEGVLLIGGKDYDPHLWGAERHPETLLMSKTRQDFDINLARYAVDRGYPVLGICGGHQLINILAGGTLFTALERQVQGALVHRSPAGPPGKVYHPVSIDRTGRLFSDLESSELTVNSFHHQAVKDLGIGLRVVARAPDGVIEAIEGIKTPVFGVQWHPEKDLGDPIQNRLFEKFVAICRELRKY